MFDLIITIALLTPFGAGITSQKIPQPTAALCQQEGKKAITDLTVTDKQGSPVQVVKFSCIQVIHAK